MKLYVGNLDYSITEGTMRDLFTKFGSIVSANIITDKFSGNSKGFGFVEYENTDAGQAAISEMNGKEINGRALTVNEARPQKPRH